jgi:type II secretory pathway pseudopilin PulG
MARQRLVLNQLGQSLMEMVVLIGLALVIVTGLTLVTISGLKNSQFSQNQSQATRLAQEAIDCVRNLRDKNLPVCIGGTGTPDVCTGGTPFYWYDRENPTHASQIWANNTNNNFAISPAGGCAGLISVAATAPDTSLSASFSSTFTRTIHIQDYPSATCTAPNTHCQQRVSVTTQWTDISGTHQSQLSTILSMY